MRHCTVRRICDDLGLVVDKVPGVCAVVGASCDDLDRGVCRVTSSIKDLVVRQSPGVLHVVLTTSDEDLVAWQSPEASPLHRFDDLG